KKFKEISESSKLNENLLQKLKILQLENIKLQEEKKDSSFLLNKIKQLQQQQEASPVPSSGSSSGESEELELLRSEVIKLRIQIKNMQPGGKADPRRAARQTIISSQEQKKTDGRYKKKAEEMKFFLKKKDMYKEYNTWKRSS
ncbi:uncharacterized protein METZ01_LOCUS491673, partial [marine metagenome]